MHEITNFAEQLLAQNRYINHNDIIDLVNWYSNKYDLGSFLKNVEFYHSDKNGSIAFYNDSRGELGFCLDSLYMSILKKYRDLNLKEKVPMDHFYNYCWLFYLFHELRHVRQCKSFFLREETNPNLVADLYSLCYSLKENNNLYRQYHSLFTIEREAYVDSLSLVVGSLEPISEELMSDQELRIYQLEFMQSLLANYRLKLFKVDYPLQQLLNVSNDSIKDFYYDIIKKEYLVLYQRLYYGLPITKKEYNRLVELYYAIDDGRVSAREDIKELILKRG